MPITSSYRLSKKRFEEGAAPHDPISRGGIYGTHP